MTPPFGKCVWCGRDDFTREHVIGHQVAKALGMTPPVTSRWGDFIVPGNGEVFLDDRVCLTCNSNWMRKLDNKMMKFMRPTIHHAAHVQLKQREQATLAFWATKVAMLLELRQHDMSLQHADLAQLGPAFVPDDNFAAIQKTKRPPKHTRIWFGALDPRADIHTFFSAGGALVVFDDTASSRLVRPTLRGYFTMFGLKAADRLCARMGVGIRRQRCRRP